MNRRGFLAWLASLFIAWRVETLPGGSVIWGDTPEPEKPDTYKPAGDVEIYLNGRLLRPGKGPEDTQADYYPTTNRGFQFNTPLKLHATDTISYIHHVDKEETEHGTIIRMTDGEEV